MSTLKQINSFESLDETLRVLTPKIRSYGGRRFTHGNIDICLNDIYKKSKLLHQNKTAVSLNIWTSIKNRIHKLDITGDNLLKKSNLFTRLFTLIRRIFGNLGFKRNFPDITGLLIDNAIHSEFKYKHDSTWEVLLKDLDTYHLVQLIILNSQGTDTIKAELLYKLYVDLTPNYNHPISEKPFFIKHFKKTIETIKQIDIEVRKPIEVEGGIIKSYSTKGEGSCGLHAILENLVNGQYVCPNVAQKRVDFCEHLRSKFQERQLPQGIKGTLTDVFCSFKYASQLIFDKNDIKKIESILNSIKNQAHEGLTPSEVTEKQKK